MMADTPIHAEGYRQALVDLAEWLSTNDRMATTLGIFKFAKEQHVRLDHSLRKFAVKVSVEGDDVDESGDYVIEDHIYAVVAFNESHARVMVLNSCRNSIGFRGVRCVVPMSGKPETSYPSIDKEAMP